MLIVPMCCVLVFEIALGPMAKTVSSPVILQAQQRFLPQTIPARFQQVISSSSGTVIAAQIIHQSNAQQTLPASVTIATASTKATGTVTIAGTPGLAGKLFLTPFLVNTIFVLSSTFTVIN